MKKEDLVCVHHPHVMSCHVVWCTTLEPSRCEITVIADHMLFQVGVSGCQNVRTFVRRCKCSKVNADHPYTHIKYTVYSQQYWLPNIFVFVHKLLLYPAKQ